jgi:hypothetical protein
MPISTTGMGIGMGPGSRRRQGQGGCGQNGFSPGDPRHQPQDIAFQPRSAARTLGMSLWKVFSAGRHGEPGRQPGFDVQTMTMVSSTRNLLET